jgi:REP element-mobilizing transposase RayT
MKNIKIKQPIHLGNNKKGKLRRIIRSKNNNESLDTQTLVVAPIHSQQLSAEHHNKQKHSFFLRKYETILKKKTKKFPKGALWGRGYFVSTVGINEQAVKKYVENQSHHQVTLEQQKLPLA